MKQHNPSYFPYFPNSCYLPLLLAGTLSCLMSCSVPAPRRETVDIKVELGEVTSSGARAEFLSEPRSESKDAAIAEKRAPSSEAAASVADAGDGRAALKLAMSGGRLTLPGLATPTAEKAIRTGFDLLDSKDIAAIQAVGANSVPADDQASSSEGDVFRFALQSDAVPELGPETEIVGSRQRRHRFSSHFNIYGFPDSSFTLGNLKSNWEQSWRYELDFLYHYGLSGNVEPIAGAYLFFEERSYNEGAESVQYDALGFGVEVASMIYLFKRGDQRPINVTFMPFIRMGLGFNDGVFENIPSSDGLSTGRIDNTRFEISLGADARLTLLKRFILGLGVGFQYWTAVDVAAVTRNGAGAIIIAEDKLGFRGTDLFLRVTLGFVFF